MKYLLMGNPNVGKTTLFNRLTNSNSKVSNFTGTTVDLKTANLASSQHILVDVPGIRSLVHSSSDEAVAFEVLLENNYDQIINVIDINNLKRNLYLTIQLLEFDPKLQIILNLADTSTISDNFDTQKFEDYFGPVMITSKKDDAALVLNKLQLNNNTFNLDYDPIIEALILDLNNLIANVYPINTRFFSIQIICGNDLILKQFNPEMLREIYRKLDEATNLVIEQQLASSLSGLVFNRRRSYIKEMYDECVKKPEIVEHKWDILLNKYLAMPLFLIIFYLVFYLTFLIGNPIADFLDVHILAKISQFIDGLLSNYTILNSLVIDGILAGVFTVILFLPHIMLTFIFLSILEGSGITSRAIIIFDNQLSKIGLNGKALAPMMVGFGCNVPAIMATRTIADKNERIRTMLIIPFMSCSARLPIYVMFTSVFFTKNEALVIVFMHVLGVIVALLSSKLFVLTIFKQTKSFFMVEVPPYRSVNFTYIYKLTSNKIKQFLKNAASLIIVGSVIIWALLSFNFSGFTTTIETSFYASIGSFFAFIFEPLGFGFWQASSSLITGFMAKELVVSQLGVMFSSYSSLDVALADVFTPASALSFMVFNLLYVPCLSTMAVIKTESKSNKVLIVSVVYSFLVAYVISFIVYQLAVMFGM